MVDQTHLGAGIETRPYKPPLPEPRGKNRKLGKPTAKWDYTDAHGNIIASVYRYDSDGRKEFRPWDAVRGVMRAPDIRPLYNQVGLKDAALVVLAEGEKCAQALISVGICATTDMNGAKAPVNKTDWSPLQGKQVIIWPDHDEPGMEYARCAASAAARAGAVQVEILKIPPEKPPKWDAADAVEEGLDIDDILRRWERVAVKEQPVKRTSIPMYSITDLQADKIFLIRAYRTTLPRHGASRPSLTAQRWRSAAGSARPSRMFRAGSILGPTFDYTHRLLDFTLAANGEAPPPAPSAPATQAPVPHVTGFLNRDGLIQSDAASDATPPDLTREPLQLPASRPLRLQALAHGDEAVHPVARLFHPARLRPHPCLCRRTSESARSRSRWISPNWASRSRSARSRSRYSEYSVGMTPFYEYDFIAQGMQKFDYQNSEPEFPKKSFGGIRYNDQVTTFVLKNIPSFKDEAFISSPEDYILKIDLQLAKMNRLDGTF